MALLEFSLCDRFHLPTSKIVEIVEDELKVEAKKLGWNSNYKVRQSKIPMALKDGEIMYYFVVDEN